MGIIKKYKLKFFFTLLIVGILLSGAIIPITTSKDVHRVDGFSKGASYSEVIPIKKTTLVGFDKDKIIDDYAYLAAIPTAIFQDNGKLFSHPLLFFEDQKEIEFDYQRSLDTFDGIKYFLDDWKDYCGKFDEMTLINVEKNKVNNWGSKNTKYNMIKEDNIYSLASQLAIRDWSYSEDAVLAIIDESFEKTDIQTSGVIKKEFPSLDIGHKEFKMTRPTVGIGGNYETFEIKNTDYKFVVVEATWDKPSFDVDMQIFDDQLGMVSSNAAASWKKGEAAERGGAYIHNYGDWEIGLTAFPKKEINPAGIMETNFKTTDTQSTGLFSKIGKNKVDIDIKLLPGFDISIDQLPSFGVRDAEFKLTWNDPNILLGMSLIDPQGTEIASSFSKEEIITGELGEEEINGEIILDVSMLGECSNNDKYKICVFAIDNIAYPLDIEIEYNWKQEFSKKQGNYMAGATNAAVLASNLNSPLLYCNEKEICSDTYETLLKLGVENIHLIDFGNYCKQNVKEKLRRVGEILEYTTPKKLYDKIREKTEQNDIIFTTIEPWEHWYVEELKASEEDDYNGAFFIGPAAYIAAHHGSPVLVIDIHPELSQASVYHKDFWNKNAIYRTEPSAGDMIISGRQVYSFLDEYGYDKNGETRQEGLETIITVAGQYNIGPTWDRTFVGKAVSGRFHFSPSDTAYWINRNMFYPAIIFVNPGMQKVSLINGSESEVQGFLSGNGPLSFLKGFGARFKEPRGVNLVITKKSGPEEFEYPVLQSYLSAAYKFNEKASKYWGTTYTRADGIIPYFQPSPDPIDVGAVPGKPVAMYPDLDDTNVIPFYAKKAGYDSVFSTNFNAVSENLNKGVLMWVQDAHGYHLDGGSCTFWNPESPYIYEENPWRAYEPILFKPGHLRTFIHWLFFIVAEFGDEVGLSESQIALFEKLANTRLIKFQFFSEKGSTKNPDVALLNPDLSGLNKIVTKLNLGLFDILGAFGTRIHFDRILNNPDNLPILTNFDGMVTTATGSGSKPVEYRASGYDFDDNLENIHSCGINTVVCLPAGTYLQMSWIRHGASYVIMDPWSTSDYCAVWLQSIIKNLALGDTIGQAYEKGIRAAGPQYLVDHWWWDTLENVCFYGDPDLRVFVPSKQWDTENKNNWEKPETLIYNKELNYNGHTPFGATEYPKQKQEKTLLSSFSIIIVVLVIIIFLVILMMVIGRKKKK